MFDPEGAALLADLLFAAIKGDDVEYIGGLETGAIPIVAALCARSWPEKPLKGFFVRKENKGHGTDQRIDGLLQRGSKVILFEDVTTTGGSAMQAVNQARQLDCTVLRVVSAVDRMEGAEESSHMGSPDLRVGGRIFATLAAADKGYGSLMLTLEQQTAFVAELPEVFLPIAGGWGRMGMTHIHLSAASEDQLTEIVLDAGAEDLSDEGDNWEVLTDPKDFEAVTEALKAAKITPEHAEVTKIASTYTKLEGSQANAMIRLLRLPGMTRRHYKTLSLPMKIQAQITK